VNLMPKSKRNKRRIKRIILEQWSGLTATRPRGKIAWLLSREKEINKERETEGCSLLRKPARVVSERVG